MRGSATLPGGIRRAPAWAAGAVALAMIAAACSDDSVTAPSLEGRSVSGEWTGSGSLYQDIGWELVEHLPGDSVTGSGYLDAPTFLDGYPAGPQPRFRIRGERNGLFLTLRLVPEDPNGPFALRFDGVVQANGRLRGEIFPLQSGVRLDVVRIRLTEDP